MAETPSLSHQPVQPFNIGDNLAVRVGHICPLRIPVPDSHEYNGQ